MQGKSVGIIKIFALRKKRFFARFLIVDMTWFFAEVCGKKLLDSGAITQEEYDTKKKELLG